jgi:hypothetical protein
MAQFDHEMFDRCRRLRQESEQLKEQFELLYNATIERLLELRDAIARSEHTRETCKAEQRQLLAHRDS